MDTFGSKGMMRMGGPTRGKKVVFESECPDCGSKLFHPGPRGGLAHNVMCAGCGSKFWFSPPFTPERIDNEDRFYHLDLKYTLGEIAAGGYLRGDQYN